MIAVNHYGVFFNLLDHHADAAACGVCLKDIAHLHLKVAEHGAVNFLDEAGVSHAVSLSGV